MSKIKERIIIPGEWSMKNITDFWKLLSANSADR